MRLVRRREWCEGRRRGAWRRAGALSAALLLAGCSLGGSGRGAAPPEPTAIPPVRNSSEPAALASSNPPRAAFGGAHAGAAAEAVSTTEPAVAGLEAAPLPSAPVERVAGDATVLRVVEVALIDALVAGDVYRLRLAGVGLPAVWGVTACYGEEARAAAERLAPVGTPLVLEAAPAERGMPAAYAWAGETLVNERLVAEGYVLVGEAGVSGRHADALLAAERAAARSIAGLWGAAVGIDAHRGSVRCESLSGYFSASHVGLTDHLREGVPYAHPR